MQRDLITKDWGLNLIVICHDKFLAREFAEDYVGGSVYIDTTKAFYKALGDGTIRKASWWSLFNPTFLKNYRAAKKRGFKSSRGGDWRYVNFN